MECFKPGDYICDECGNEHTKTVVLLEAQQDASAWFCANCLRLALAKLEAPELAVATLRDLCKARIRANNVRGYGDAPARAAGEALSRALGVESHVCAPTRTAIAILAALDAESDWRPIETVPEGPGEILGWAENAARVLYRYDNDGSWVCDEGWPYVPTHWKPVGSPKTTPK